MRNVIRVVNEHIQANEIYTIFNSGRMGNVSNLKKKCDGSHARNPIKYIQPGAARWYIFSAIHPIKLAYLPLLSLRSPSSPSLSFASHLILIRFAHFSDLFSRFRLWHTSIHPSTISSRAHCTMLHCPHYYDHFSHICLCRRRFFGSVWFSKNKYLIQKRSKKNKNQNCFDVFPSAAAAVALCCIVSCISSLRGMVRNRIKHRTCVCMNQHSTACLPLRLLLFSSASPPFGRVQYFFASSMSSSLLSSILYHLFLDFSIIVVPVGRNQFHPNRNT